MVGLHELGFHEGVLLDELDNAIEIGLCLLPSKVTGEKDTAGIRISISHE